MNRITKLPSEICVPYTGAESNIEDLIDIVFPILEENMTNSNYITSWAILSTRNENIDGINMNLIECFLGEQMVYHSFDSAVDDPNNHYPRVLEFFDTKWITAAHPKA